MFASWSFSEGNYGQNNAAATVPVGIRYQEHSINAGLTHRFGKNVSGRLEYGFDYYREPSSGGANDFDAHTVFAILNFRLP